MDWPLLALLAHLVKLQARHLRHLHAILTLLWALLAVPTVMWWRNSVAWVAAMSLYANVAGHWAAWQAARAEEHADGSDSV